MIDPLERIENMIRVHGWEKLSETRVRYTSGADELLADSYVHAAMITGTAAALIERFQENLDEDDVKNALRHLTVALFFALGALTNTPPGIVAMGAAMSAPPSAVEMASTVDELVAEAEIADLAIAMQLADSEEVTDSAEG